MTFRLAPMTSDLRALTWVLSVLLAATVGATFVRAPDVAAPVVALMFVVYAGVWFVLRPSRFEIDTQALQMVWPVRRRAIAKSDIVRGRVVTSEQFRKEQGLGLRIGAGGLWGSFGLLRTRTQMFSMWISRTDRFVVLDLRGARPLLLTPEHPERFVEELRVPSAYA